MGAYHQTNPRQQLSLLILQTINFSQPTSPRSTPTKSTAYSPQLLDLSHQSCRPHRLQKSFGLNAPARQTPRRTSSTSPSPSPMSRSRISSSMSSHNHSPSPATPTPSRETTTSSSSSTARLTRPRRRLTTLQEHCAGPEKEGAEGGVLATTIEGC